jgi:hypothetical protein
MTVRHIFEISEDDHPPNTQTPLVTHARESANIDELQTIELEINWKPTLFENYTFYIDKFYPFNFLSFFPFSF